MTADRPAPHEDLVEALAQARGRVEPLGVTSHFLESPTSTNDVASALAANGAPDGTLVVAESQTEGRGRRGRHWFSPAGAGLYASVLLRSPESISGERRATALMTITAGVGLAEGIAVASGLPVTLKWPNDLHIHGRKLGGVLAEAVSGRHTLDYVILGFGINVRSIPWPADISDRATSIEAERGTPVPRSLVLVESLAGLATRLRDLREARYDAILNRWRDLSPSAIGSRVRTKTEAGWRDGQTAGIDDDGALMVGGFAECLVRVTSADFEWV